MIEEKTLREVFIEAITDEFAKRGVNAPIKEVKWNAENKSFIFETESIIMTPRVFKKLYVRSRGIYYEQTKNEDVYKVSVPFDYRWEHFDYATNGTSFLMIEMYVNTKYPDVRVINTR